ncbi:NAD(P)-dependent oxidoreductase [Actinopolymorpha sp. B9G3]|uniref:NAD(P)-dependent oxidoreductase n=1 Tax=Actinopolymorpha sp. B9G3 TaxID=3158970 RepID=UPI0032D92A77
MPPPDYALAVVEDVWGEPFDAFAAEHPVLRRPDAWSDRDALRFASRAARALAIRNRTRVDAALMDSAPHLRVLLRAGVGLDNIDLDAADARGVVVVSPRSANAQSVAEHTLALALCLARDLVRHDTSIRDGRWERTPGSEIGGGVWGLLGAGATARAVARLARGLDMHIRAYDPFIDSATAERAGIELCDLAEVAATADVLSIHLPADDGTRGIVGEDLLARLRPTCLLVNVGRGETVDEEALASALHRRQLAGAALDVRATEPPGPGPLDDAPNLVLSPHVAGITRQSQNRIAHALIANLRALLRGEGAPDAVGAVRRVTDWAAR